MSIVQFRASLRGFVRVASSACVATLLLPACTKQTPDPSSPEVTATSNTATSPANELASELNWARDALKRNPTIEIVATDTNAGVFTVRFKDTGEVRTIKLDELAAVPVSTLATPARKADTAPATQMPATTSAPQSQSQSASAASSPAAAPTARSYAAEGSATNPNYTIERADGQVKVSGPGVSIVSSGATMVSAAEGSGEQRSAEPIICEGRRMLHFDNRDIYVEGDAIVARGGCELYITNSRVAASGTAVVIQDATVHIANSTIDGSVASFDAGDSAKVYVRSSTFQGLPRRAERAVVQDQGGNQWR